MAVTQADFDAVLQGLKDAVAAVAADVAALRAQLASGVQVTDADLAGLQGDLDALKTADMPPAPVVPPTP